MTFGAIASMACVRRDAIEAPAHRSTSRRRRLEAGDDVAPPPAPVAPVAKSIKCVATGKLFPTMAAAQAYAAKTGRTDFEESTEECVPEPPPPEDPEDDEMYT